MKLINSFLLSIALLAFSLALVAAQPEYSGKPIPVPDRWIVELDAEPTMQFRGNDELRVQSANGTSGKRLAATAPEVTGAAKFDVHAPAVQAYSAHLDQLRESVLDEASFYLGRSLQPDTVYRHVFNGFALSMSAAEAAQLAQVPGVRSVRQDMAYKLELDEGPGLIGAPVIWSGLGADSTGGAGVVIGIIDSGINWDHRYFSDNPSHTGGHTYTNPLGTQLGECSKASVSCNNKLIGVWDFTTEGTNGRDPDDSGHGTHVASTAAGNPWSFPLSDIAGYTFNTVGVAPQANIISYKVCYHEHPDDDELDGRCVGSAIVKALDQVVADGVDVVNYSIGGTPDDPDPWKDAQPFLNVRNAGILFVTSAGNSGSELGTVSSPANAPWTFAVGSTTHRRRIGNTATVAGLTDLFILQGSGPALQSNISGPVIAADQVGGDLRGCSSFPAGSFSGAIAFMIRGDCTFATKVNNAANAGAVAVLIYNNIEGAFAITMGSLEDTSIPSAMLDNPQGEQAYSAIQSATNPSATLFASRKALVNQAWQDQMSGFSSRGPGPGAPGIMKPNVAAPGDSILGGSVPNSDSLAILSGTSMASPHAAGAVALLKAVHPDWTADMIQSALETTAEAGPVQVGAEAATMLDRGAGRLRVDRAARVGLYLPISPGDFNAANPSTGGEPEQLNLPGITSTGCADTCTFKRTVRAIKNGSWTVGTAGALDISVSPSSFNMSAGQELELTIEVSAGGIETGDFGDGSVVLSTSTSGLITQRLPVGIQTLFAELPESLDLTVQHNRGQSLLVLEAAGQLIEPVFRTSALVKPRRETFTLNQDPSPNDPYSGGPGTRTFLVDVPEDALMLYAETVSSTAPDIDLFVGLDLNGDGVASESEEVCRSTSPDELEKCMIEMPEAGQWWVLVQNWEASSATANDNVALDIVAVAESEQPSLVASGVGRHPGNTLRVPVYWDQPAMKQNERWMGAIGITSTPDELVNAGVVPVSIRRVHSISPQPTALYKGEPMPVVIAPNGKHDLLYFDVPPSATSISVQVQGDAGVSAELRRMSFDDVEAAAPGTPSAGGVSMASGSGSSSGFTVTTTAEPGRWYVVLDSISGIETLVDVTVNISESNAMQSQRGLWSPRARVISQGIEWQRAGPGFITWYSYDADGLPVFYQAIEVIEAGSSVWRAPLYRITNSTGQRQNADVVGQVSLTMVEDDMMVFAWRLEGFHGSDIMSPDAAQTCPEDNGQPLNYTGHWYSPDNLVGGTTMIVTDSVQAHIRYYFDNLGVGRWVFVSDPEGDPLNEMLELYDFRGFCPGCTATPVDLHQVGTYTRVFESESTGTEVLEFVTAEPLNHEISIDVPVAKLSEPMSCQ